jgi:dTDP-4-dehydrorhamnose 3,5-epimerase-like enzyme
MEKYKILNFKIFGDERGALTAIEGNKEIPFDIKRVFYIYNTKDKNIVRGDHANRKTKFVLIMLSGSSKVKIFDEKGGVQEIVELDSPDKGLFLENMVWKEMYDFTDNSVMLVLASEPFDEFEYIDTYEELLEELKNG